MRKTKKILSFVLIFSLIVATFACLNLYDDVNTGGVYADEASTVSLNVVKIGSGTDSSNIKKDIENAITNCTVTLSTYTVAEFNADNTKIKDAELIIIDEDLGGTDLTWASAMAIFNKVVGRNGSPAKFMISGKAYGSSVNNYMITNGGTTEFNYYYRLANAGLKFDSSVSQASVNSKGSSKNLYKLFLMLNTYDNPATMYGLFFGDSTTAHGINVDGNLIGWGETVASEGSLGENKQYNTWSTTALKPYHYMNSTATSDELKALGYKETFGLYEVKEVDVVEKVGHGGSRYDAPYGGYDITASMVKDSADLTKLTVFSASRVDYTPEFSGGNPVWENGKVKVTKSAPYSIALGELGNVGDQVSEKDGKGWADWIVEINESAPKSRGYYSMNKAGVYFYGNVDALFKSGVFVESFTKLVKAADKHEAIGADGDVRILVVQPNGDLAGSGMKVNESVALKMYEKYYTSNNGKTPIDGISAEMMSMYEFNSTSKVLNDSFDIIYLGAEADGNYSSAQTAYGFSGVYATSGTKNSKTTQGNDMSSLKEEKLRNFNGFVAVSKELKDASIAGTVVATYLGRASLYTVDADSDFTSVIDAAYDRVKSKAKLVVLSTPQIYNAENFFDPTGENNACDYTYLGEQITEDDYINGNGRNRDLKYRFKVSGSGSYTVKLYVDFNADGLYDEDKELKKTESVTAGSIVEKTWKDVLPDGYVGSVPWKLVLVDSSNKVIDSVSGMSACKKDDDSANQIVNILQIVPDSDYNDYSSTKTSTIASTFVIPTTREIANAEASSRGKITSSTYNANTVAGLEAIKTYFSGYLSIPIKDTTKPAESNGTKRQVYTADGTVRDSVIYNAGLFYYFMAEVPDYTIKTTRYSLYELEHMWANDGTVKVDGTDINASISYDAETGSITYTDSMGEVVTCDLLVVGFADAMVRDGLTYTYQSSTGSTDTGTKNENVDERTANMIAGYISKDRYALVGRGALNTRSSETLTSKLIPALGMTTSYTIKGAGFAEGNGSNGQNIRVNEGSITRYPYNVPISMNSVNTYMPIYNLNVNDQKIVGYYTGASLTRGVSEDNAYGNTIGNYFLYRRGNMTYVNMGLIGTNLEGQKAGTYKLPDAVLLVNTIVSMNDSKSKQKNTPNLVPENPGVSKSSTTITTVPEGDTTPVTSTKNSYHFYVDYEVTEPSSTTSSLSNSAMNGDKYIIVDENGKTYERVVFKVENGPCTVQFLAGTTPVDLTVKKYSDDSTVTTLNNGTEYYIDVPINNSYYTSKGITSGYGLENGNNEFTISAISTSTIDSTKKGYDDFVIARRGLFLIN